MIGKAAGFLLIAMCVLAVSCKKNGTDERKPASVMQISLEISEVTDSSVEYVVKVSPEDSSYLCGVVPESEFTSFSGPEEFIMERLSAIKDEAASAGKDESLYLKEILCHGSLRYNEEDLSASTEYIVYAVGVNAGYCIVSDVAFAGFRTDDMINDEDALFSFSPEMQGLNAGVTVTPAEELGGQYYFYTTVDKSVLDWKYGGIDNLQEKFAESFVKTIEELVYYMNYDIPQAVASICWKGTQTFPVRKMIPDTDYYMLAAGIDESSGKLNTEVCHGVFHSNQGGDLGSFTIDFNIGDVNVDMVEVNTVPSDNMVRYYFDRTDPEVPDEDIIAVLYSTIDEYIESGAIADANGFYSYWCSVGPDIFTYTGLDNGTYRIYGFGIDNSGLVATDLMFSEEFTVGQ